MWGALCCSGTRVGLRGACKVFRRGDGFRRHVSVVLASGVSMRGLRIARIRVCTLSRDGRPPKWATGRAAGSTGTGYRYPQAIPPSSTWAANGIIFSYLGGGQDMSERRHPHWDRIAGDSAPSRPAAGIRRHSLDLWGLPRFPQAQPPLLRHRWGHREAHARRPMILSGPWEVWLIFWVARPPPRVRKDAQPGAVRHVAHVEHVPHGLHGEHHMVIRAPGRDGSIVRNG